MLGLKIWSWVKYPVKKKHGFRHSTNFFQPWKFMRSSIHYAIDERKSNIEFDAVPLRQILSKCSKIKQAYDVLCAK